MVKMVQGVSFNMACPLCSKSFGSTMARDQHVQAKHQSKTHAVICSPPHVNELGHSEPVRRINDRYPRTIFGEKRLWVEMAFDADTERLYGDLTDMLAYVTEIRSRYPNARLAEHWTGYETMEMVFVYSRQETDAEYEERMRSEEEMRESAERERAREKAHAAKVAEYQRLRRELGYR